MVWKAGLGWAVGIRISAIGSYDLGRWFEVARGTMIIVFFFAPEAFQLDGGQSFQNMEWCNDHSRNHLLRN